MDIAFFSFFYRSRLASNCGYAERLVDQTIFRSQWPDPAYFLAIHWAIKISHNALLLIWTLFKWYELKLTRPCSSFVCTSLGYGSRALSWEQTLGRSYLSVCSNHNPPQIWLLVVVGRGGWKGKLLGVRIGGDAKFIGGGEPIYSGLAGIPAPPSASLRDRISHHKPFPSQSLLRISSSTQSEVFVWKADWEELFPEIKKFGGRIWMLFGATSHYMQTLHVDCNHLKMTNYGMHETNRYGAMNVTGVFFFKTLHSEIIFSSYHLQEVIIQTNAMLKDIKFISSFWENPT